jgi:peroxiredoxin
MTLIGQLAPEFTLPDSDMKKVSLSDYKGSKNVVLYFYPKDYTLGATREAIDFTELSDKFDELDAVVLGVNRDSCMSHANFMDEHGLSVRLLSDIDGEVCELYGVWQKVDNMHEQNGKGMHRYTFIIDKQGIVRYVLPNGKSLGHVVKVLELVKTLRS